jgi:hypothetical protein
VTLQADFVFSCAFFDEISFFVLKIIEIRFMLTRESWSILRNLNGLFMMRTAVAGETKALKRVLSAQRNTECGSLLRRK